MLDIKWIREHPDALDAAMAKRRAKAEGKSWSEQILALDAERRAGMTRQQELQQQRNQVAKSIGEAKRKGEDASGPMAEAERIKQELAALESELGDQGALGQLLSRLPNLLDDDVPDGDDESANVEVRRVGSAPALSFSAKEHDALGDKLGMDFEQAGAVSGARFVYLRGGLARMERALAQFMLNLHTGEFGYEEVAPPYLVRDAAVFGTGQLPKFAEDLFQTTTGHWLIPTAEVSLTNLAAGKILSPQQLPMRLTAYTPCFRSEAGSAGRDTRGMIRQHQFSKVELVAVTAPEESKAEHEKMVGMAEEVLKRLGLHYRVVLLSSGDTGFCSQKTYDLEVWLPGQKAFREISSVSNCGDFQARRMNARVRSGEKETRFVHTLNGSALAVGRCLVAVLENYQQADGSVVVPEVLRTYMGGVSTLAPDGK